MTGAATHTEPEDAAPDRALQTRQSSLVEKVIEYRFLAAVTAELLRRGMAFDVMRSDVDCHGHDLVIAAGGVLRHIQLKAMALGGKRANVTVHTRLAMQASGCIIWVIYDPDGFEPVSFRWFGGAPGVPMPDPGTRVARHAKSNAAGVKLARPMHRVIPARRFEALSDVARLVDRLFGPVQADDFDIAPLSPHLQRGVPEPDTQPWLTEVRAGKFAAVPGDLDWESSIHLALLVDGYVLAGEAGLGDPLDYAERQLASAQATGVWPGGPLELWISLFLEHRRWRFASPFEPDANMRVLLDRLVAQLRQALLDAQQ